MHKDYIKGLDGLRAIAISWVMFGHLSSSLQWPVTASYQKIFVILSNTGWIGVQLFFVLSGFLITGILLKGRGQENQLRNFYARRSLRIFPVYYLTLLFFFIIVPLVSSTPEWLTGATNNQLWYWLYLQNWIRPFTESGGFSPLWSLAIEEQFYLIWPLLVLKLRSKVLIKICILMIVSAPIFRFLLFYEFPDSLGGNEIGRGAAYGFTFARWDALALGSLLALLKVEKRIPALLSQYSYRLLLLMVGLILIQIGFLHNFTSVESGFNLLNQTTSAMVFFVLVFIVYSKTDSILVRSLEWPIFKYIGKYSYAMYLFHLPLIIVWIDYIKPDFSGLPAFKVLLIVLAHYLVIFGITFLLALVSWKLLEHPLLKLKRRFA